MYLDGMVARHIGLCSTCLRVAKDYKRVACFIVNYNMPERADALYNYLYYKSTYPTDIYLVDNGSNLAPKAYNTNVTLKSNRQTTNGWLQGVKQAKQHEKLSGKRYFAYMFLITSTEFIDGVSGDVVKSMVSKLYEDENAVGVHPALTEDSTTAWTHLKYRGYEAIRPTWFIDNIASMYRASWYNEVGGFDKQFKYAHGIDLELCYLARKQGKGLYVDERVLVKKVTDIGYTMGRMNMTAEERQYKATANMYDVMQAKYGDSWQKLMFSEYVTDNLR